MDTKPSHEPAARAVHPQDGAGAQPPRLIEWSGERCVPWIDGPELICEHYHRYLFAGQFVAGKRVLDLASGEGYGVRLLSESGAQVVGVEIDEAAVQHARLHHAGPNIEFSTGSILDIDRQFPHRSFDVVTCFEAIEHVDDHPRVLEAIDHVLRDDGMLFVSTPDREPYDALLDAPNPYHVHELDVAELLALLRSRFAAVRIWEQRFITGSIIAPLEGGSGTSLAMAIQRAGPTWQPVEVPPAPYQVAVATRGNVELPSAVSWLEDRGREVARGGGTGAIDLGICWTDDPHEAQQRLAVLDAAYAKLAGDVAGNITALYEASEAMGAMQRELAAVRAELQAKEQEAATLRDEIAAMQRSKGWRSVLLVRRAADAARRLGTNR